MAVQLEIVKGMPFYQTVLVDSTNFAGANWSPWTGTNLSVDLGSVEGWHDVWVGLRGFSAGSYQAWGWKRLKLELTPPQLALLESGPGGGHPADHSTGGVLSQSPGRDLV